MKSSIQATNKKQILFVITRGVFGGAQSHVYDLLKHAAGVDSPGLIVGEEGPLTEMTRELDIPVWIANNLVSEISPIKDVLAINEVTHIVREFKPDIIHAHSSKAGIVARVAAKITRTPCVFTAHGWGFTEGVFSIKRAAALVAEKLVASYTQRIICVSEYDRQLALKCRVGNDKSLVTIHNGIRDDQKQCSYGEHELTRVVMVARFSRQKDQQSLIRAVALMNVPVDLWFVGDGELLEQAKDCAQACNINDRVRFLGDRNDVPDILAACDIFVLSSWYEGLPYSILEAMRAGLPTIVSNVGGTSEALIDGETGFLIPAGDVSVLSNRIEYLVKHPDQRKKMGQEARKIFLEKFLLKTMLDSTFQVYDEVLAWNLSSIIRSK
jgi:glycosyltransferase involved in cell wall biosynthesis